MATTTVVAWIGAVSGVSGLIWDFYKWKTSGPKLSVSVNPGMVDLNHMADKNVKKFMLVKVRNTGTTPSTITTLSFVTYESWWNRKRLKWTQGGVVMTPITAQPLPYKLEVGGEWAGTVSQDGPINEQLATGNLWCDVYHSWSKMPAHGHVMPKDKK